MDCTEIHALLPLSLDCELDAHSEATLVAHIDTCANCREYQQKQQVLRTAIRQTATYHRATASLAERIRFSLPAADANSARAEPVAAVNRWKWVWQVLNGGGLIAAACAMLVLAVVLPQQPSVDERLTDEVIASHARALLTQHVIDVESTDRHTVNPWFNGKLDFSPPVRDLADKGFQLVGGRLDYLNHRAVAVVVYRRRQHLIDVFIWPSADRVTPPRSAQGYHVAGKTASGMRFLAVSDVDPGELKQLVEML